MINYRLFLIILLLSLSQSRYLQASTAATGSGDDAAATVDGGCAGDVVRTEITLSDKSIGTDYVCKATGKSMFPGCNGNVTET